jgi:hypothetical protein
MGRTKDTCRHEPRQARREGGHPESPGSGRGTQGQERGLDCLAAQERPPRPAQGRRGRAPGGPKAEPPEEEASAGLAERLAEGEEGVGKKQKGGSTVAWTPARAAMAMCSHVHDFGLEMHGCHRTIVYSTI